MTQSAESRQGEKGLFPVRVAASLLCAIGLFRCNVGTDPTPLGCKLLTVKAASYKSDSNRIYIRLSDGSLFWTLSTFIYGGFKDKRVGEFQDGEHVIVCPPKSGARTWFIRNNTVGMLGSRFHKVVFAR